jgi:hypothetical protein
MYGHGSKTPDILDMKVNNQFHVSFTLSLVLIGEENGWTRTMVAKRTILPVTRTDPGHPACIKSLYSLSYFISQCCVKVIFVSVFIVNYTVLCKLLRMYTVKGRMTVNSVN